MIFSDPAPVAAVAIHASLAKMHILHVLNLSIPIQCGYSFRTQSILEHQRREGWRTSHVTSAKHEWNGRLEEVVDDLPFYRTPPGDGPSARMPVLNQFEIIRGLSRRLEQVIERERPDVLHAHSPALTGMAALKAGRRFGLPVVYECRAFWEDAAVDQGTSREGGWRYRMTRALETHVFRHADAITTICQGLKDDIVARGIPEEKVTIIPNAIDLERFHAELPRDERLAAELGLERGKVLGFIGSFFAYEGLTLLLKALPLVRDVFPDVKVLLVGGGEQDTKLRRQVIDMGLSDSVVMTGRVPYSEVGRYYSLVDLFVYPRMPIRLTELVTPLKPLEAMAQGRLVVASDIGGHRELIAHGETGWLFRAGDPYHLALSIKAALESRDQWEQMRRNARAYVERERNWGIGMRRYRRIYASLASSRPGSLQSASAESL